VSFRLFVNARSSVYVAWKSF